ncbi:MAG: ribosome small subunit-dependent GTPase A [Eubacteriales bacterium]|nr:ribosome small subunit-dependent GTPase A [Eubacteriales bacterium]
MTACEAWISAQHHDVFSVYLPHNGAFINAALSGKLRLQLKQKHLQLVAGDRVTLEGERITALHERRSLLSRIEAGGRGFAQALAANMDYVFICTSPNEEFNIKRVDRYLAMADGAGVEAVLLITKADIAGDLNSVLSSIQALNPNRQYLLCSAITGQGLDSVRNLVAGGKSAVLMGSSGVGKSSLINAIVGDSRLETSEISAHKDKGRHTTTSRTLIPLDNGGFFIDSPGIRELQLDNSDAASGFADITVLAGGCRFRNCAHMKEPGCAVREAVASGTLRASRLDSYLKLKDEERKPGKRLK